MTWHILAENGDSLLAENGDYLVLEQSIPVPPVAVVSGGAPGVGEPRRRYLEDEGFIRKSDEDLIELLMVVD